MGIIRFAIDNPVKVTVGVTLLVVVGPERLPRLLRTAGRYYAKLYDTASGELIWSRLGFTIGMTLFSTIVGWGLSIPLGVYSATHRYTVPDYIISIFQFVGVAIPAFLLALLLVYGVLGSSHNGRFDLKLVAFPTLVWLAMWAVAFGLGEYFARAFADAYPSFTVLGFHPSFAAIILLFWLLPTLLMGFGFEWVKDRWLSSGQWEEYLHRVHEAAAEERGEAGSE